MPKEDWVIDQELRELAENLAASNVDLHPASSETVDSWEKRWRVELPITYRRFIMEVSDGLNLPRRTVLPLTETMTTARGSNWFPDTLPADFLTKPFPYDDDFNPDYEGHRDDVVSKLSHNDEYAEWWLKHFYGTLMLSDHGGDRSSFLVVTGKSRGEVWADLTVTGEGLMRAEWDFLDWLFFINKLK